jgi:hypothetical protein
VQPTTSGGIEQDGYARSSRRPVREACLEVLSPVPADCENTPVHKPLLGNSCVNAVVPQQ